MKGQSSRFLSELTFAISAIVIGIGVAALIAPHEAIFFWPNFRFYWLPQAAVLGLLLCLRPSPALFGGVAFALAIYLASFATWVFSRSHPESMAWLGYYFSMPGALIGAGAATALTSRQSSVRPVVAALLGFGLVVAGVAANQTILCTTVFYCLGH